MEIRVQETLTGRRLRDKILAQYGTRDELERAAAKKDGSEAREDLAQLRLLDADPRRLSDTVTTTTVATLEPGDIRRLTPQRVRILEHLAKRKQPLSLTQLTHALKRDKKHLSEDLRILEGLGLLTISTEGRTLRPYLAGNEIRIMVLEGAGA